MKRIGLLLIIFSLFINFKSHAQIVDPVKWSSSIKELGNGEALLVFEASIVSKWHLYSQFFPEGGPIRLSFRFEPSSAYELVGKVTENPKPKLEHDDVFEIDVQFFTGKATFSQKIKILSEKDFKVKAELEGQACSDEDGRCVPLDNQFEFAVKGFKGAIPGSKNIEPEKKKVN
jgi:hypothetical protein